MAIELGVNSGFVTTAPTTNPAQSFTRIDGKAGSTKHTSPTGAIKITEIGWYCSVTIAPDANYEVGLYSDNGAGEPNLLLDVSRTNSKGTTAGWKTVTVDWEITEETVYWLDFSCEATGNKRSPSL